MALLRGAQRFAEEVATERRRPRTFEFDLPLPEIQPETLGNSVQAAKIAALTVPEARKLGIPKTTLWYHQKRLRQGAPVRVYQKVARRLDRAGGD
ncbi:MAG TPA: hypothetical protein VFF67_10660 [Thermoplasmata archaeon]|nr:hypothetical protein [Thermoplasmata archaeon]